MSEHVWACIRRILCYAGTIVNMHLQESMLYRSMCEQTHALLCYTGTYASTHMPYFMICRNNCEYAYVWLYYIRAFGEHAYTRFYDIPEHVWAYRCMVLYYTVAFASMHMHAFMICRNICEHAYIHTYMHTYIHTYMVEYIHTYICTYIHTRIHTYIETYTLSSFITLQTIETARGQQIKGTVLTINIATQPRITNKSELQHTCRSLNWTNLYILISHLQALFLRLFEAATWVPVEMPNAYT